MVLPVGEGHQYPSWQDESRGVYGQYRGTLTPDVSPGDRARLHPTSQPGLFKQKNNQGAVLSAVATTARIYNQEILPEI